jgi:hypothetical protein
VRRTGDQWTLRTSTNGTSWVTAGSFTAALDVARVGPYAGNAGSPIPAFTALVDYVFDAAAPVVPEDTPGVPGTTTTTTTAPPSSSTTTTTTTPPTTQPGTAPQITLWYGNRQVAGVHGRPQTWVNVLGNVRDTDGVQSLGYTLNGGPLRPLTVGPDNRRLQFAGDFNAEVPWADLQPGDNTVVLSARDTQGNVRNATVVVERRSGPATLPHTVDWSSADRIDDVAQPVDGRWAIDGDTVRPTELGYDRIIAIGDAGWHDYEMTVPVTVHGLGPGNGSYLSNNSLVGFGLNWQGHTQVRTEQPGYFWYPTGALGWYRWYDPNPKFELRGNGDSPVVRHQRFGLAFGTTYMFKARSDTVAGGVQYSWKVWPQGTPEPASWDLTLLEPDGPATGSLILIAHHADVQFGDVTVTGLGP